MTTPGMGLATSSPTLQGSVVQPAAVSSASAAAVHGVAQVLMDLVHHAGIYKSESQLNDALDAIAKWVRSAVKPSEMAALATGEERAAHEDVSERIPPGGYRQPQAPAGPPLDYDKLAAAIMRIQAQQAQQVQQ